MLLSCLVPTAYQEDPDHHTSLHSTQMFSFPDHSAVGGETRIEQISHLTNIIFTQTHLLFL